jgi:hypothetical protein
MDSAGVHALTRFTDAVDPVLTFEEDHRVSSWPTWDEWLASLPAEARDRAIALAASFERRGAHDPQSWARAGVDDDVAQMARFLILRRLWADVVGPWMTQDSLPDVEPARRLLAAGADAHDVMLLGRSAAYDAMVSMVGIIDAGADWDIAPDGPGWSLMETDADGESTGRPVSALHESLLETEPSGNDGENLWD